MPYFCTGFIALRSTVKIHNLLNYWTTENSKDECACNQRSFQKAVIENDVNGRVLPLRHFPYGALYFEQMPKYLREQVVIAHNNFLIGKVKKILRFKDFGLWLPEGSKSEFTPNSLG